jgi:predicted GNAT family N-acyltransferase
MNVATRTHQPVEHRKDGFLLSTDPQRLDVDFVYDFLTKSYWAKGISRELVLRSIENSLCFGVYTKGKQIAFARIISDFATYAYLGDVFVIESYRGHGLGKWMMECIRQHPQLQDLRRWTLLTRDAHGLYAQFGFTSLVKPDRYMELHDPEVYERLHSESAQSSSGEAK